MRQAKRFLVCRCSFGLSPVRPMLLRLGELRAYRDVGVENTQRPCMELLCFPSCGGSIVQFRVALE